MEKKSNSLKAGDRVRVKVSLSIRQEVLLEAGYKCANPVCRNVIILQTHHIIYVSDGGCNESSNLLALCGYCHDMHHNHHFTVEAVRVWKRILVALNNAFDRKSIDLLLFLTKQWEGTSYSGDGILQFAGLIAAGLVTFGTQSSSPPHPSTHQLRLTDKGKLLVEAWMAGNEAKYLDAMSLTN